MVQLRRGFKTWCENAARGYRRDLKLEVSDCLDPKQLAGHLGVSVRAPEQIDGVEPSVVRHLLSVDPESWSAVTLRLGSSALIISNSAHARTRQNNSLAHELSHLILQHEPAVAFVSADGTMILDHYNPLHEEEANCLAGTLLVPRAGLLFWMSNGRSDEQIAKHFDVSLDLLRMRRNTTGVATQLGRRRR
jgi:hypothetical protein